ncbi:MAG: DUF763 domain-containing protein [Candidatus Brockarchaeota archaeon]|nr:DUF763 domain-containing protein [Candidatus Brockarchaeota archaeon]
MSSRKGFFDLRLHGGRAPQWLVSRMIRLGGAIVEAIVMEFGTLELLKRVSDPLWFQGFSNVLGYDWDSSGSTTVTAGVLKTVLSRRDLGVYACGGKGAVSRRTPSEIESIVNSRRVDADPGRLAYLSRICAKVDNSLIQAGYQLYHHVFIFDKQGNWAVVQQGMNTGLKWARRYHWLSEGLASLVEEPHSGIIGVSKHENVLNLTARESRENRQASLDIVKEPPQRLRRCLRTVGEASSETILKWIPGAMEPPAYRVVLERNVNWRALSEAYELKPGSYEELLSIRGVGPGTLRALSLVAQIVFDAPPSWRDPVKFSFSFGGKDGVPYPVNRRRMDRVIGMLEDALSRAKMGEKDKLHAVRNLKALAERLDAAASVSESVR